MKKKLKTAALLLTAFVLLLAASGAQAAATQSASPLVNVLVLASEDMGDTYFPIMPMIISLDFANHTVRVVHFYFETQIFAVTRDAGELSIPMSLLPYCDIPEIVKAYENTYGIPIDRYLIYLYEYGSYAPAAGILDLLGPVTLDISEEILGTAKYTTINGNMKSIAREMDREYKPIEQAGLNALDAAGFFAYFCAIPDRVWESNDPYTMTMEDYKLWDMKNLAVIEALRPIMPQMSADTVRAILEAFVRDQTTDIVADDIDAWVTAWAAQPFTFSADPAAITVPGFEGVTLEYCDASSIPGVMNDEPPMLTYDNAAVAEGIQKYLFGE